jgi:hypothetical protein
VASALGYYIAAEGIPVEPFVALVAGAVAGTLVLIDRSRSLALADAEPDPAVGLRGSLTYAAGVARRLIAAATAGVAAFQYGHSVAAAVMVAAGVVLLIWAGLYLELKLRLTRTISRDSAP